jgi:hypothetical protein
MAFAHELRRVALGADRNRARKRRSALVHPIQSADGSPRIAAASTAVGAFAWTSSSSTDSAILITLPPGAYAAQAASPAGNGAVMPVEIYAVK